MLLNRCKSWPMGDFWDTGSSGHINLFLQYLRELWKRTAHKSPIVTCIVSQPTNQGTFLHLFQLQANRQEYIFSMLKHTMYQVIPSHARISRHTLPKELSTAQPDIHAPISMTTCPLSTHALCHPQQPPSSPSQLKRSKKEQFWRKNSGRKLQSKFNFSVMFLLPPCTMKCFTIISWFPVSRGSPLNFCKNCSF